MVRDIERQHFGREVSPVPVDEDDTRAVIAALAHHEEHRRWRLAVIPSDGDIVFLASGRRPTHVGVWAAADGGGVVHCQRQIGAVFSAPLSLVALGWRIDSIYTYRTGNG